jgi:hypothetical protein
MKYTILVLAIIAAGCGAASIYLGRQLSGTREELALEVQAHRIDQARIRQLEGEHLRYESASNMNAPVPAAPPPGAPPPVAGSRPPDTAMPGGSMPPGARADRQGNAYNSPAAQNTRRIQQEIRLRRSYADMPAALGLDADQADKLFDLLADNRVAAADNARGYAGDPTGSQSIEAAARQQRDAEIEALLGPDKAAEFQSFEKSLPARMQVNRIGEDMAAADVPLSQAQRTALIAAVVKEQEIGPPPQRPTARADNPDYQNKFLDWQADYSRRVQTRVEPLLTQEQRTRYRESVEVQNVRRSQMRARTESERD